MKRQPWFWPVKLFLKRVLGRELWLRRDIRLATQETADWNYIGERLGPESVVYSLGVGDSIDFDMALIRQFGLTVYAFDPTPYAMQWLQKQDLPANFVFNPWAASVSDGLLRLYRRVNRRGRAAEVMWTADESAGDSDDYLDAPAYTLRTMMQKLGHERIDLLKMDVEGAEFLILDALHTIEIRPSSFWSSFTIAFPGLEKNARRAVSTCCAGSATRYLPFPKRVARSVSCCSRNQHEHAAPCKQAPRNY